MRLIVFTNPENTEQESELINTLFDYGLECLHVRKPNYSKEELSAFIDSIEEQHHEKLVLHSHYDLTENYKLRGVHFSGYFMEGLTTKDLKSKFDIYKNKELTISRTVHSFMDLEMMNFDFSYIFLSPLFDSISKVGYTSKFDLAEVYVYLKNKKINIPIYALGGITEKNVETALSCGFKGIALLGEIWKTDTVEIPRKFKRMRKQVSDYFIKINAIQNNVE